jgi:perosamine synthetase
MTNDPPRAPWIDQMAPWLGAEEQRAVSEYVGSGGWLTEFKQTTRFEEAIAEYVGSTHCVVVANGTVSLVTALLALGIGPGDEVIVPDLTMIASATAVVLAGARPVLVDIDLRDLCLDLDLAEQAITPRTRALMLVSLNGRAPDMDRAAAIAAEHGLHIVEDAAQSLGSRRGGRHLGTFGEIGSFSFSAPKIITTGQGGALVTDDDGLATRMRRIKDFGRRQPGVDHHESIGFNFKFTDLQAVVGLEQMRKLPWRVARKKEIYALYRTLLEPIRQVTLVPTDLEDTTPWFIDVLVPDRSALAASLRAAGIGSRPCYPAIHGQPAFGIEGSFPNSDHVAAYGLWLPSSSALTDAEVGRVCAAIRAHYEGSSIRAVDPHG